MLQIQIIGNLTRDAEIKQSQKTQDNFLTFTIAVNEGKDKPAIFIRCLRKAYDNTQNLMQYMTKGKKVYVQGKPSIGVYTDQQSGNARPDITCFVEHIELLGGNNEVLTGAVSGTQASPMTDGDGVMLGRSGNNMPAPNPNQYQSFVDNTDGDLPF